MVASREPSVASREPSDAPTNNARARRELLRWARLLRVEERQQAIDVRRYDAHFATLTRVAVDDDDAFPSLRNASSASVNLSAPFRDAAGGYLPLLCTLNCTRVVEEAREVFGAGRSHDELGALAAEVSPGCDGVRFLPYLVGERTPNWPEASGALVGLRPGSLGDPGVAYRAAMEGATYGLVAGVEKMRALGLKPPKRLVVVGGGARSRAWRQIVADAFGAEVRRPAEAESAALGAATQALAALEGAKDLKAFVEANPPEYLEEVEVAAPERTAAHEANRAEFEREGKALFG